MNADFNSIKVRLEREGMQFRDSGETFQFHKGAIRTRFHAGNTSRDSHFNSIKVRLEPCNHPGMA